MYKLIAIDVDGTLLNSSHEVSDANREAIKRAIEKSVMVILCSGRSHENLKQIAQGLDMAGEDNYIIAFNGCVVYDNTHDRVLMEELFDKDLAIEAIQRAEALGAEPIVYKNASQIYIYRNSDMGREYNEITKVDMILVDDMAAAIARANEPVNKLLFRDSKGNLPGVHDALVAAMGDRVNIFFSAKILLEAISKKSSKGFGLQWICNHLGIDIADAIAIGDNYNDISMIEVAGLGVAMNNAEEDVKKKADYVTVHSNDHSGVAEVINKFILGDC